MSNTDLDALKYDVATLIRRHDEILDGLDELDVRLDDLDRAVGRLAEPPLTVRERASCWSFRARELVDDWRARRRVRCIDCRVNTVELGEYYMVRDDVWPVRPDVGMLCIGCLEQRIGRRLTPADFIDAPVNHHDRLHSARLQSRLNGAAPAGVWA